MTCCDFLWKKSGMRGIFLLYLEAQNPQKKNHNTSNKNPKRFHPWLRQNVGTIIVLMRSYDQWYSIRRSIVPAGKEMTQIISKRLGIKNIAGFNGFFRRFFFVEKSASLLEVWFRSELSVGESLSRNQIAHFDQPLHAILTCHMLWHHEHDVVFFFGMNYIHICLYITGGIIRQHSGNNRQHHQKYMSSFSVFHFVCLSIVHVKPVPSFILERNNIPSKIFIAEGWADQMSRWYVLNVGATSRWKIIEICNGKSWNT